MNFFAKRIPLVIIAILTFLFVAFGVVNPNPQYLKINLIFVMLFTFIWVQMAFVQVLATKKKWDKGLVLLSAVPFKFIIAVPVIFLLVYAGYITHVNRDVLTFVFWYFLFTFFINYFGYKYFNA